MLSVSAVYLVYLSQIKAIVDRLLKGESVSVINSRQFRFEGRCWVGYSPASAPHTNNFPIRVYPVPALPGPIELENKEIPEGSDEGDDTWMSLVVVPEVVE